MHVFDGLVLYPAFELLVQCPITCQPITPDRRASLHLLARDTLKSLLLPIWDNFNPDVSVALAGSHDRGFVFPTSSRYLRLTLTPCMFRALPIKFLSTSISPSSFSKVPLCIALPTR